MRDLDGRFHVSMKISFQVPDRMSVSLFHDFRGSVRMLSAKPGFALAVVLTLALGIGCNVAIFSVIQGLLLRPLPYPESARLVHLYNSYPKAGVDDSSTTVPDYLDRRQASGLAESAIFHEYSFDLADQGVPQRVVGVVASPSLFRTLDVGAELGRVFREEEAQAGNERVVLLSHALWSAHFNADPSVVGREVRISGRSYLVVGVMPAWFAFPRREIQLWVPFAFSEIQQSDSMRGFEFAQSIGRLAPDASIEQLHAEFDAIVARSLERLGASFPDFVERARSAGFAGRASDLHAHLAGTVGPTLWLLQGAVALLLLIACVNVANLMLIRSSARQREIGVRAALGASRARLAQQWLVESTVLALAGGVVGMLVALAVMQLLRMLGLDGGARGFSIGLDASVFGVALASVLLSILLAGLLPILALGEGKLWNGLKEAARGNSRSRGARTTRSLLVVLQVCLAVALLMGAGLLLHSFKRVLEERPGFDSSSLLTMSINLSRDRYREPEQARQFQQRLLAAVRELPGVRAAATVSGMLFSSDYDSGPYVIEGQDSPNAPASGYMQAVDPEFFPVMGIPLVAGRGFAASDDANSLPVAIIDASLARRAFGERSPLGARIGTRNLVGIDWHTIVGVAASVKRRQLSELDGMDTYYSPLAQVGSLRIFRIAIKTDLSAEALAGPLRAALAAIDPEQPFFDLMSMDERISRSLDDRRAPLLLVLLFAVVALALCAVGIYGVLAFAVSQRTSEIGVRLSLGASRAEIARMVLFAGGRLVLVGMLAGLVLAWLASQLLRSQLFGVGVLDPVSLLAVSVLVAVIGLLATGIPARRAAAVSPVEALRHE